MNNFRLWLGSLPYQAQPSDIYNLFADLEITVSNLDISINSFTGRNPGYLFVDVASQEAYDIALERLQGQTVRGRSIKVNSASARTKGRLPGTEARIRSYDGGRARSFRSMKAGYNDSRPTEFAGGSFAFNRWPRGQMEAARRWEQPGNEQQRLYVGGLPRLEPQSAAQELIKDRIFQNYEVEAVSKMISPHGSIRNTTWNAYHSFVDLTTQSEAKAAVRALDGRRTEFGFLKVRLARDTVAPKVLREQLGHTLAEV